MSYLKKIDSKLDSVDQKLKTLDKLEKKVDTFEKDMKNMWSCLDKFTKKTDEKIQKLMSVSIILSSLRVRDMMKSSS